MKKNSCLLALAYIVLSCSGPGTSDTGTYHQFNCTRAVLQSCLEQMKRTDVTLDVPDRWVKYGNWEEKDPGFLNGVLFAFEGDGIGGPRMYYVSLVKQLASDTTSTTPSYAAVRAMFSEIDGNPKWTPIAQAEATDFEVAEARVRTVFKKFGERCSCEMVRK